MENKMKKNSSSKMKKSRNNLPKEAVDYLMKWLYENRFRAYPCEVTKRQMSKDTGLTLQQVNNWYINARRRILPALLSKEGKEPNDYRITRKRITSMATDLDSTPSPSSLSPSSTSSAFSPIRYSANETTPKSFSCHQTQLSSGASRSPPAPPLIATYQFSSTLPPPPPYSPHSYPYVGYVIPNIPTNIESTNMASVSLQRYSPNAVAHNQYAPPPVESVPCYQYSIPYHSDDDRQNDSFLHTDHLLRTRYGNPENNFRVLEFNMI